MKLLKPSWMHHDENPIFSIDIHPDGSRIVTGGQGNDSVGRVVIWNMEPILTRSENSDVPKLLCQLDHHNACVNCVRWSNSGKFLCSGGDDRVIIIWKLVLKYNASQNSYSGAFSSAFGKANLEQWKPLSMLRSHTGDVLDLAWSPEDNYLASASVDNTVIVWDACKFPQIVTTLKGHNSLVKGVTWDPVGKYLASQSDDKTLKVWRISDWELEQSLQDPFIECGGTTHVLRLHWSPDGSYLVSAHAMNGGGPTAQIVERTEWKTDKDFVGHRKAVVCVKFNGNIMHSATSGMKHCCVALGSRDRSVSIWSTALKRPLVVLKDLFTNSVMDLSWSKCGTIMMACSWDGSVAVAQFSWKEIGRPLSLDEKSKFFQKLYGKSVTATENCDIVQNLEVFLAKQNAVAQAATKVVNDKENVAEVTNGNARSSESHSQQPSPPKGPVDKQIEVRLADGRRRITPKFLIPPSDREQEAPANNEQTAFMQSKGTEDVIANNPTAAQDWRKNMVSSIDTVRGFTKAAETNKINMVKESDQSKKDPDEGANSALPLPSVPIPAGSNEVEPMHVEEENPEKCEKVAEEEKESKTPMDTLPPDQGLKTIEEPEKINSSEIDTQKPEETLGSSSVKSCKQDLPSSSSSSVVANKDEPNLIAFRKKNKAITENAIASKPKKIKLATPEPDIAKLSRTSPIPHTGPLLAPVPHTPLGHVSPTKPKSLHRLPPMKMESVLNLQVNITSDNFYSVQVMNFNKRLDGMCHQVQCLHSSSSYAGLEWTMCTDAPICGVFGDVHRIVMLCENSTAHVLDTKGRYAFPPLVLSGQPSKCVQNGAFLAVVTTKAIIHVWDTYSKRAILKGESLLPILNQKDSEKERVLEIARIQVATDGRPIIILNTGKMFTYSFDLSSWLLISDPRGLVSAPLASSSSDQPLSSRLMLFGENGRIRGKPEPAVISHIKLKLAAATELKNAEGVKQWMIALAKSLATYNLKKELHQLCEDLLGPTHSSARMTTWNPTMIGVVNKRELLRQILTILLEDLKHQELYCEFDELLREVEENNESDSYSH